MKKSIFYLLIFISIQSFCQDEPNNNCKKAEIEAEKLAEKGEYIIQNYGLPSDEALDIIWPLFKFYTYSKYGVTFENNGCFPSENDYCFGKRTNTLFKEKYGENFLDSVREKIKSQYKTLTLKEKKSFINIDKIYSSRFILLESVVKYIGNDVALKKKSKLN